MPLIPYPDVPSAPGVPDLPRNPVQQSQGTLPEVTVSDTATTPSGAASWAILDDSGADVITPDSFISFEYRGEQKIPNYPIEKGSFASYNKVAMPFDIRTVIACGGQGAMTRQAFTDKLTAMLNAIDLYTVATPDAVYESVNLVHVNYRREAKQGVTLLLAELWFDEVRQTATATPGTAQPAGAAPVSNGQVAPVAPTPAQNAAIKQNGGATGPWISQGGAQGGIAAGSSW